MKNIIKIGIKRRIGAVIVLGIFTALMLTQPIAADDPNDWTFDGNDMTTPGEKSLGTTSTHDLPIITDDTERMRITSGGRVGIGDTSPDFKLEVTGSSGDGYFGVSSTDDEGDNGDIFIIDSNGKVGIGTGSPDVKLDVELSGDPGTVGGAATIGEYTNSATGDYAIAMGSATTASEYCSTAMGAHTIASGSSSVAMGIWSVASGANSVATGASTDVSGFASLAFGGFDTEVTGDYSCAIGTYLTAGPADDTYVIGRGQDVTNHLVNNIQKSFMVGFDSTTPTLFVDGSSVGIGTTGPDGKLDILSTSGPQLRLSYTDGSVYTDLQTTDDGFLYINPSQNRVGIETIDPASTLSVAGGVTIGSTWASSYAASAGELLVQNNVGIGVTNPAEKLEIDGNVLFNFGSDSEIKIEDPPTQTSSDGNDLTVRAGNANLAYGGITDHDGGNLYLYGGNGEGVQSAYGGDVYIYGGTAESEWPHDGDVILAHNGKLAQGRVGIGTTTPVTTLDVNGGFATEITKKGSEEYDVTNSDFTILADASSNDVTVKLPSVEGNMGRILVIKRIDDNIQNYEVIVGAYEGQKIDEEETKELVNQYDSIMIQASESDWWIISSSITP
jgi:hypothetical protein